MKLIYFILLSMVFFGCIYSEIHSNSHSFFIKIDSSAIDSIYITKGKSFLIKDSLNYKYYQLNFDSVRGGKKSIFGINLKEINGDIEKRCKFLKKNKLYKNLSVIEIKSFNKDLFEGKIIYWIK